MINGNNIDLQQLSGALEPAKNVLILLPNNPTLDGVAGGLAFYLTLQKTGKNVAVACPTQMTVAFNRLVAVDKITSKIGSRNLVISFDYIKDSIEKVSYHIENNKFNLVIEPKANFSPLDPSKVSYSHSGASADLVIMIGATKLEDFDRFYYEEKKMFDDKNTINIDYKPNNSRFGKINLVDNKSSSCSEIVVNLIRNLSLPVDSDIATNLYTGIKTNTNNFQSFNISATAFETSAWCLNNGARQNQFMGPMSSQPVAPMSSQPMAPITNFQPSVPPPFSQPIPTRPMNNNQINGNQPPPADWLKPKIYQGKTQI